MAPESLQARLGLNVPYEWWPTAPILKEIEAAGYRWVQIPSPPPSVLASPRQTQQHAQALTAALEISGLRTIVHGPTSLRAGSRDGDRVFEGLLAYAAEIGGSHVVYHAADLPDGATAEDMVLSETRSLGRLARRAEALGVTIALENLAPVFPSPERLSFTPLVLRTIAKRIDSPAVGLCIDVGHANVVAGLRATRLLELIAPALDSAVLFHLHDNLGARRSVPAPPELDPLRLDLHLPPGRGTVPWTELASALARHEAPLMLEVHPPHRSAPADLFRAVTHALATGEVAAPA